MARLTRFRGSVGFAVKTPGADGGYSVALFFPKADPPMPDHEFASVTEAFDGGGVFAQVGLKTLPTDRGDELRTIIARVRDRLLGLGESLVFALVPDAREEPRLLIRRDASGAQVQTASLLLNHLGSMSITPQAGGAIAIEEGDSNARLRLGVIQLAVPSAQIPAFAKSRNASLDLVGGRLSFSIEPESDFLAALKISQPFVVATDFDPFADLPLISKPAVVSVVEPESLDSIAPDITAELDLIDYARYGYERKDASKLIHRRSRLVITGPGRGEPLLRFAIRDTRNTPVCIDLQPGGQQLRFLTVPRLGFHRLEDPDELMPEGLDSFLVPSGRFDVAPAASADVGGLSAASAGRTAKRRLKVGLSNVEVVEVQEAPDRPAMCLDFGSEDDADIGVSSAGGPSPLAGRGALLRRSFAPFARALGEYRNTSYEAIARSLETGLALSPSVETVWPGVRPLNDDGSPGAPQEAAATNRPAVYSVQPDGLARFAPGIDATAEAALDHALDPVVLPERVPMTFLHGIPEGRVSDHIRSAGDFVSMITEERADRFTHDAASIDAAVVLGEAKRFVTPQGFEVSDTTAGRRFVLARSSDETSDIEITATVRHRQLARRFQQNETLLVFPTGELDGLTVPTTGLDFTAEIRLEDWNFKVEFDPIRTPGPASDQPKPRNGSIVVLKYRKGKLRDQLLEDTGWSNREFLTEGTRADARDVIKAWLESTRAGSPTDERSPDRTDPYRNIRRILDNEDWNGVLIINPAIDLGNLPAALLSVVPGMDVEKFRGHHLGFTQNRLEWDPKDKQPAIKRSSLFGLIDYKDKGGFPARRKRRNDSAVDDGQFDMLVEWMRVVFANSEVQDFDAAIQIRTPSWFKDAVERVAGGATRPGIKDPDPKEKAFRVFGRYEALYDDGTPPKKIGRYSFICETRIELTQPKFIFERALIDRVELTATRAPQGPDGDMKISTTVSIDAEIEFRKISGGKSVSDVFGFDRLGVNGLGIGFDSLIKQAEGGRWRDDPKWKEWLPKLSFGGISVASDPDRRRKEGLISRLPVRFERLIAYEEPRTLKQEGYMSVRSTDGGDAFEYALVWDVNLGRMAALLGLDTDLSVSLLTGWRPENGGFAVGLKFKDLGGDRLDFSLGSVLRIQSDYFDVFSPETQDKTTYIVANNLRIKLFHLEFPPKKDKGEQTLSLLFAASEGDPLGDPMGWLTTYTNDKIGFVEDLLIAIGQHFRARFDATTPKKAIDELKGITSFEMKEEWSDDPAKRLEASQTYREKLSSKLVYDPKNDWFLAFGGKAANKIRADFLYNPPSLFGGQLGIADLIEIGVMYKQLSPRVGVYSGVLKLGDAIRSVNVGIFRFQIPKIETLVDTEGGFGINVGLNLAKLDDYSDAATVEFMIFKGDGGFYFSRLNGDVSGEVPVLNHDEFPEFNELPVYTPVTRTVISARGGVGREFKKPMLKAGASITSYGILSGTWGKRNFVDLPDHPRRQELIDLATDPATGIPDHYQIMWGERGFIADIYGVIDFGITKFRLNARLLVGVGLRFETWHPTVAYVRGEIRVAFEWVIASFKIFGKRIVIKITLRFSAEFREEFRLAGSKNSRWNRWFTRGDALHSGALPASAESILPASTVSLDWSQTPSVTAPPIPIRLLLTMDLTLGDDGKPRMIPLLFFPLKSAPGTEPAEDQPEFSALLRLVLDWSLAAAGGTLGPIEPTTLIAPEILDAFENGVRDWDATADRGSWSKAKAWDTLKTAFRFTVTNEPSDELETGVYFAMPDGLSVTSTFADGSETSEELGTSPASAAYMDRLNGFYEDFRIVLDEMDEDDGGVQPAVHAAIADRPLTGYMFEEHLESLLRTIWDCIAEQRRRQSDKGDAWKNINETEPVTVSTLRAFVAAQATKIGAMVNRLAFSGVRVPASETGTGTVAIWERAGLTLDPDDWGERRLAKMRVSLPWLQTEPLEFEADPDADLGNFPRVPEVLGMKVELEQPGEESDLAIDPRPAARSHPLVSPVPLRRPWGPEGLLWDVPEPLLEQASESGSPAAVTLEEFSEGETGSLTGAARLDYRGVCHISIPVRHVPDSADTFEIQQFEESERRRLDAILRSNEPGMPGFETLFARSKRIEGAIESMESAEVAAGDSYIGRVNLSVDPNPTSFGALRPAEAEDRPVRAGLQDPAAFLELLRLAAETNSGGYLIRLAGWKSAAETERIELLLTLGSKTPPISRFVNRLLTGAEDRSAVLREQRERALVAAEPGVLAVKVTRQIPAFDAGEANARALGRRFNLLHITHRVGALAAERDLGRDLPTPAESTADPETIRYRWSVPVSTLLKDGVVGRDPLFESDRPFPYAYVGQDVPLNAGFRDVLGFAPTLPDETTPRIVTPKYSDPLLSPAALPALGLSYSVALDTGSLEVHVDFDPNALRSSPEVTPEPPAGDDGDGMQRTRDPVTIDTADESERLSRATVQYRRALDQLRDGQTEFTFESTLGLGHPGEDAPRIRALTRLERREFYDAVASGLAMLEQLAAGQTVPPSRIATIRFAQAGLSPRDGAERLRVSLGIARSKANVWDKIVASGDVSVVSVISQLQPAGTLEELDGAIADAFTGSVVLAAAREVSGAETVYLVSRSVLDLKLETPEFERPRPAYAAFRPLGLKPYTAEQADLGDWLATPPAGAPPGPTQFSKVSITGFDRDAAFEDLLRDVERELEPARAAALWAPGDDAGGDTPKARALDELVKAKYTIAEALAQSVDHVHDLPGDAAILEASRPRMGQVLTESFRLKLDRYCKVDVLLLCPLSYAPVQGARGFYLYGGVIDDGPANASRFLPAALRRDAAGAPLVVQYDAGQPATEETRAVPRFFEIDWVRTWNTAQSSADGDARTRGAIWLKLVRPARIDLDPGSAAGNEPSRVPIPFRRLVTKPNISTRPPVVTQPEPNLLLSDAIAKARKWEFEFDVERVRAALQDDLILDVRYNVPPDGSRAGIAGAGNRPIGELLYEFAHWRETLRKDESKEETWLAALAYWLRECERCIRRTSAQSARTSRVAALQQIEQWFTVRESRPDDTPDITVRLHKLEKPDGSSWDDGGFSFTISARDLNGNPVDVEGGPLGRLESDGKVLAETLTRLAVVEEGYFAGRRVTTKRLDIMKHQNAWPAVRVQRNAKLAGVKTNPVFIYESDRVLTGNPLTPYLNVTSTIHLNDPGAPHGDLPPADRRNPEKLRPLHRKVISGALEALFDGAPESRPLLEIMWGYESGELDAFKNEDKKLLIFGPDPIGRIIPTPVQGAEFDLFLDAIDASLNSWENANGGVPDGGRYAFDFLVYSGASGDSSDTDNKPLLRLSDLRLHLPNRDSVPPA